MPNVAVIGAGVNGVSSAIKILEHYQKERCENVQVTIISDEFTPNTTGDGSAGLWGPFLLGGTCERKVQYVEIERTDIYTIYISLNSFQQMVEEHASVSGADLAK